MNKIYTLLALVFYVGLTFAQSDNCSGAVTLTVSPTCSSPVSGSTFGFTQSSLGCVGNADDDGWYRFVATATSHSITVTGLASFDPVVEVFSGNCLSLSSLVCRDNTFSGQAESINLTGLTAGNTYFIRVYNYYAGSGNFTICLTNPPAPPANDDCANAINLTVNTSCSNTAGTTVGATQSLPGCSGTADDDVWYRFTATSYTQTITFSGSSGMDGVVQLYSGTCGAFNSISCVDNTLSGGVETINAVGLTPGQVYYLRIYDYYSGGGYPFSVCVVGTPIGGGQPNDDPCNAIQLPPVTSSCNYLTFSTLNATNTGTGLAPTPFSCIGGSGGSGGFISTSLDVWFKITVPASGNVYITPQPNLSAPANITDGSMALYSGTCGSLTQISCSSDYTLYPGSGNDLLPYIAATGQTPGATLYLRYWKFNSGGGSFGLCVQSPTNDDCVNALYVCDINGYSGSTSAAYTPDRPGTGAGQMYANNETAAGVNQTDGINTCGPFGYYPNCPATTAGVFSSPAIDVNIENNSWIRFTAGAATANLRVSVGNCWVGNYPTGGIQMQIFSSTGCDNFSPVSSFREGSSTFTITANGLTVGNNYYLMVDGYAKDICNYTIQALDGVALPEITATPTVVCPGQTTILTAPSGATSYEWFPGGLTTQTIAVNPGSTITYTLIAGGVCGAKQTLTKTINVYSAPSVSINANAAITTCGTQTLTLTGGGASTYSWSTGNTTTSFTTAPTVNTTYSVIGTSVNGCTSTAVSTVTVNTRPTILPAGSNTICTGQNTNLTVSGANTYTWSPAATLSSSTGTNVTATPTVGTNYTIIGTAVNGCTNSATYSVTVNSKPNVGSTTTGSVICNGTPITLSGTGATTYTWTGGVIDGASFTPGITTTYTVNGTLALTGCTNTAVRTITVTPLPTLTVNVSNPAICLGNSTSITASGATTYTLSNGVSNGSAFSPTSTATYTITGATSGCSNTAVSTVTVNPLPTVTANSNTTSVCNGSPVTLTGSGTATSYTWTGGITNGVAFNPSSTNTYTVTGIDGNSCVNRDVRTIAVNTIPTTTVSTSGIITCATTTVNLNSNLAGANYTWTAPGGSTIAGGTANSQNAIGQGAGTYTINVMSAAGCSYSTTLATNVNTTTPTASATGGTLTCATTSTILTGGPTSGVSYSWSGPGILGSTTSANITATVVGTYSLITTSLANGCSSSAAAIATVTNNLTTPTVTAGSNQTITCAAPTVTLTGSATSGSSLSWSNGSTSNTTTVGGSGTYTLTATNPVTGCTSISTVQVAPSAGTPTGTLSAVSGSITCANTTLTVGINTTVTPVSITWAGPGITGATNTSSTTVSTGGTYTVTLTNTSSMCSQSYPVFVPSNTTPVVATASVAASSSITCSTYSLTLSSTPTGVNYSYSWSGPGIVSGGTTANPVVNAGGNYSVTITNTISGCSGATGTTQVFVPTNTAVPTLSLSSTSLTTTCGTPTTVVTVTSNSNPNTTYTWTPPSTGTINNTSISAPVIGGSGIFTVAITNTVNGCPSLPANVAVTADANVPTFTLSANSLTVDCTTPAPSVTISTNPSGLTYSWSPTPNSGGNTATPTFTAAGNYTCLVTNPTNSCSTNVPVVNVSFDKTLPTVTATPASSITCSSITVSISSTVTPTTNINYNWTGPNVISGATTLSPVIGAGGNYVIVMTNTVNGCVGNYTVNVPTNTLVPNINLSANAYTTTCSVPSVVVTATSSADPTSTYSWTAPSAGTISNTSVSNPSIGGSGVFTVAVTNTVNGCVSAIETVTITADANTPTFTLTAASVSITCTDPAPGVTLNSANSNLTYSWSPTPNTGANTASPTFTAPGNYTCVITNTVNNCTNSLPVVFVDLNTTVPSLSITQGMSITCVSNTVTLTSTVNPTSTYTWTGNGIIGNANGNSVDVNADGTYTLTIINPVNGCTTSSVSTVVTNTAVPTLTATSTSTVLSCSVGSSTLTVTSAHAVTWTLPGGATATNPVIAIAAGDYTATVTDNANGCTDSRIVTIVNNITPPDANAGAATVMPCGSTTVTLLGTSTTTDAVSYSWAGPNAGSITSGNTTSAPTVTATGSYTLTVTNLVTGCTATAVVNVSQNNVTADFTPDPLTGEAPLAVNFTNQSTGATTYSWNFGNGSSSTTSNPSTVFNNSGTYTVTLIASTGACSDTASKTIFVEDGFSIEIPNVFTPNGDSTNDAFHIKIKGVKSAEGFIYNRWGQLLHSWNALNTSWDGKASNGENCPDGTYYYLIKVIDNNDKEHIAPGYVLIAR